MTRRATRWSCSCRRKRPSEVACQLAAPVVQLAPGDADDAPAGERELAVAQAVGFEALAGAVRAAVELDDQPLRGPDDVADVALDDEVPSRPRQVLGIEEGEEV